MVSGPSGHPLLRFGAHSVLPLPLRKGCSDEEPLLRLPRHLDKSVRKCGNAPPSGRYYEPFRERLYDDDPLTTF